MVEIKAKKYVCRQLELRKMLEKNTSVLHSPKANVWFDHFCTPCLKYALISFHVLKYIYGVNSDTEILEAT